MPGGQGAVAGLHKGRCSSKVQQLHRTAPTPYDRRSPIDLRQRPLSTVLLLDGKERVKQSRARQTELGQWHPWRMPSKMLPDRSWRTSRTHGTWSTDQQTLVAGLWWVCDTKSSWCSIEAICRLHPNLRVSALRCLYLVCPGRQLGSLPERLSTANHSAIRAERSGIQCDGSAVPAPQRLSKGLPLLTWKRLGYLRVSTG